MSFIHEFYAGDPSEIERTLRDPDRSGDGTSHVQFGTQIYDADMDAFVRAISDVTGMHGKTMKGIKAKTILGGGKEDEEWAIVIKKEFTQKVAALTDEEMGKIVRLWLGYMKEERAKLNADTKKFVEQYRRKERERGVVIIVMIFAVPLMIAWGYGRTMGIVLTALLELIIAIPIYRWLKERPKHSDEREENHNPEEVVDMLKNFRGLCRESLEEGNDLVYYFSL